VEGGVVTCCACEACRGQAFWLDGPVERPCFECRGTKCTHGEGCIEDHDCHERHVPCDLCGECRDVDSACKSEFCDDRGDWLRAEAKDEAAIAARGGS
jgi:hypothetical protein